MAYGFYFRSSDYGSKKILHRGKVIREHFRPCALQRKAKLEFLELPAVSYLSGG